MAKTDVIIYTDDMNAGPTTTSIREALKRMGFKNIGLVSVRNIKYEPHKTQHKELTDP